MFSYQGIGIEILKLENIALGQINVNWMIQCYILNSNALSCIMHLARDWSQLSTYKLAYVNYLHTNLHNVNYLCTYLHKVNYLHTYLLKVNYPCTSLLIGLALKCRLPSYATSNCWMFRHTYLMKNVMHSNEAIRPPSLCPPILRTNAPSNSATHSVGLNLWVCVEQWCSSWCCSSSTSHNNFRYRHMHCMECFSQWVSDSILLLIIHSNQLTSW